MIKESYNVTEEAILVKAALDGNKEAFGDIVTKYQKMVARTVKGMLGDSIFTDDIGQEVFIKLYYSKLSTYIQKIAVNLTLNEIKRRKRFFSMFSQKGNNEMYEFEVADQDNEERRDSKELVNKALLAMDPKFRIILTMRMLQGYSTKETAEILDLPLGTVLSRLSRAQEQLRNILEKL